MSVLVTEDAKRDSANASLDGQAMTALSEPAKMDVQDTGYATPIPSSASVTRTILALTAR